MIPQRTANLVFAALLMATLGYMAWVATGFETPALGGATLPTHFFPLVLLAFIAVCTLVYGFEYLSSGGSGGDQGEVVYEDWIQARRGLFTLVATCAGFAIWREFGFMAAGLATIPAVALAMGTRKIWQFAVILIGAGITYLVFTYGLGTEFR